MAVAVVVMQAVAVATTVVVADMPPIPDMPPILAVVLHTQVAVPLTGVLLTGIIL